MSYNECITLVGDVDNEVGNMWEFSVPSSQFAVTPKLLLKIVLKNKTEADTVPHLV